MILGVRIKKLEIHQDIPDRVTAGRLGFLLEVLRDDDKLLRRFGQSTLTVAYEGTIKAFHLHKRQDDLWFIATGRARIVLHDLRKNSITHGETQVIMAGADDYKLVLIPVGVAHGYQVLSTEPVLLFYHTSESYDPKKPDEERLPHDDPSIHFDWNKQD